MDSANYSGDRNRIRTRSNRAQLKSGEVFYTTNGKNAPECKWSQERTFTVSLTRGGDKRRRPDDRRRLMRLCGVLRAAKSTIQGNCNLSAYA